MAAWLVPGGQSQRNTRHGGWEPGNGNPTRGMEKKLHQFGGSFAPILNYFKYTLIYGVGSRAQGM